MSQVQELSVKLHELLLAIEEYELADQEMFSIQQSLYSPSLQPSNLKKFDSDHMEQFIEKKIGVRPVEPDGLIKLLVPVYLIQKAQFDVAIATYNKMRPLAEAAYREEYTMQREQLRKQDEYEKNNMLITANNRIAAVKKKLAAAKERIDANNIVSTNLKKKNIIIKLISYFEEGRADNLKEAVNLYYDEKRKDEEDQKTEAYRKQMKSLEEEKVRAAQAAEEYQKRQYEQVLLATEAAQKTADIAENMQFNQLYRDN